MTANDFKNSKSNMNIRIIALNSLKEINFPLIKNRIKSIKINPNSKFNLSFPDVFVDLNGDEISYSVFQENQKNLPEWISFQ